MISQILVLLQFIETFSDRDEPKRNLESIWDTALSSELANDWNDKTRSDFIFTLRQVYSLIEALFILAPIIIPICEFLKSICYDEKKKAI